MQFQATCSKWSKKLTLTLNANDLETARNTLHSQWYSIIEIHESVDQNTANGNFFYFDAKINWILQSWKIQSTDIFKSYKKLSEDLKYDILYIYTNEWMPEEAKKIITAKVRDGYRLYKESLGQDLDEQDEKKGQSVDQQEMQEISREVLKEIEKYTKVIDSSVEKIQNIFLKYHETITIEQKSKLENLENILIQTKWTKNLWKIKTTVESWLIMIWETELSLLKIGMTDEKQKFLDETNALLKQVWSKDRIETDFQKENTLEFKINNFFTRKKNVEIVPEKEKKDINSFIYYKNKRELDIYKKKLNSIEIDILKAIWSFQLNSIKKLFLKRKLITQNIEIIDNRINKRAISYTKILHGIEFHMHRLFLFVWMITNILFYTLFFYTLIYIILHTLDILSLIQSEMDGKSILFITLFSIVTLFFSYIRGLYSAIIITPILFFFVYFLSINF